MALSVQTILTVSDVPTSRSTRSSMVALPEQVERIRKCAVFQAARSGGHQIAFPLGKPRHVAAHPPPHFRHVNVSTLRAGPTFL
jgi:hypothetical protein